MAAAMTPNQYWGLPDDPNNEVDINGLWDPSAPEVQSTLHARTLDRSQRMNTATDAFNANLPGGERVQAAANEQFNRRGQGAAEMDPYGWEDFSEALLEAGQGGRKVQTRFANPNGVLGNHDFSKQLGPGFSSIVPDGPGAQTTSTRRQSMQALDRYSASNSANGYSA